MPELTPNQWLYVGGGLLALVVLFWKDIKKLIPTPKLVDESDPILSTPLAKQDFADVHALKRLQARAIRSQHKEFVEAMAVVSSCFFMIPPMSKNLLPSPTGHLTGE